MTPVILVPIMAHVIQSEYTTILVSWHWCQWLILLPLIINVFIYLIGKNAQLKVEPMMAVAHLDMVFVALVSYS